MQDETGWLLHLIHAQKQTDAMYLDSFDRHDAITVRLRPEWEVAGVEDALTGETFDCRGKGSWTEFTVPGLRDHTILRIRREGPHN